MDAFQSYSKLRFILIRGMASFTLSNRPLHAVNIEGSSGVKFSLKLGLFGIDRRLTRQRCYIIIGVGAAHCYRSEFLWWGMSRVGVGVEFSLAVTNSRVCGKPINGNEAAC